MQLELVVFDMAGTTVFDGDAVHHGLMNTLHKRGIDVTRDQVNEVMGISKPLAIQTLLEVTGKGKSHASDVDVIHQEFVDSMINFYQVDPSVKEIPGTTLLFQQLRKCGIKVVLDTGFTRNIADTILHRLGWNSDTLIAGSVTTDEVNLGRPHPDMIFKAMEITGVTDPASVAKVGDTPSDLGEGTSANCGWVIGVTEGSHTWEQLSPFPHTHLIGNVTQLPEIFALN